MDKDKEVRREWGLMGRKYHCLECKNYALSVCLSWSVDVVCLLKDSFDVLHDSDVPHNM